MMVTDLSLPIAVTIGPGDEHEGRKLIPLIESIKIKQRRGRPRRRPKVIYGDNKYDMPLNMFYLRKRRIRSQIHRKKPHRNFDKESYSRMRSAIERFNGWIKAFRRVLIRFDRLSSVYTAFVHFACIVIYLRILQ